MLDVAVLAPLAESTAIELGRTTWRKQVMKLGRIDYKGRTLDFTPAYCAQLADAFRSGAYDAVPFVLADADNRHTQDPERTRGEVIGLEATPDGLDAIVSLTDTAAAMIREHPKFGVSVRIEQPLDRADGVKFPAAVQHVLGTWNPRLTGMRPWEQVELSADDRQVLDLSTYEFTDDAPNDTDGPSGDAENAENGDDPEETPMPEEKADAAPLDQLTADEVATLRAILADAAPPTEEELAAIRALDTDTDTDVDDKEPAVVAAASDARAIELAAQVDSQALELAALRHERDVERFEKLRDWLAIEHGIPPRVTELARPLLTGTHVVELAGGGTTVDATKVVHDVLVAVGQHVKLLDLSAGEPVYPRAADADETDKARDTAAAEYVRLHGLA